MIDVDNDVVHAAAERAPGGMCTYLVAFVRLPALRHDAENFLCLSVFGRTRALGCGCVSDGIPIGYDIALASGTRRTKPKCDGCVINCAERPVPVAWSIVAQLRGSVWRRNRT